MSELSAKETMAVNIMKHGAREAFRLCSQTALDMAKSIEADATPLAGPAACRLLAAMFDSSAKRD
jgi:hypothetical protein